MRFARPCRVVAVVATAALLGTLLVFPGPGADAQESSLKDQLPRVPPTLATEAGKTFTAQHGFSLELVASEPLVCDPIDAAFDEDGRMYVVEMRDYPFLPDQRPAKNIAQRAETWGAIRLLEDTNGDGTLDKSVVFADQLRWPQSVCPYQGGVFVISPPSLWYLKDTTGDGVADVKEELVTGFSLTNVQALSNGLEWGLDHGIYWAGGRSGAELRQNDMKALTLTRQDLRLDPSTRKLTTVSGGEQFGHTFDDWGNRFVCNNSNHLEQVVVPSRYLDRNPQVTASNVVRTIAKEGAAAPVYRQSPPEPWRVVRTARRAADPNFRARSAATELVATGFFTSATGVTVYRGGAYPPEYQGNVFIGDVGGNLVHRKKLVEGGIAYVGERTEENVEFLTSSDNWFRPANFVNAPDGTLYILDMYRETIEHPASIPEDIKEHVDLESGYDRGRIYRLVSPGMQRFSPPKLGQATGIELVAALESPHGWVRETAHRLIWERQDKTLVPPLRTLATQGTTPLSRVLALWSLEGLQALIETDVLTGLKDTDWHVREQALVLAERLTSRADVLLPRLAELAEDPHVRVRWQLAFSLGEFQGPIVVSTLQRLAREARTNPDMRLAILTSISKIRADFAIALLKDADTQTSPLLRELLTAIGAGTDPQELAQVITALLAPSVAMSVSTPQLLGIAEGLKRRGSSLQRVIETFPAEAQVVGLWKERLQQSAAEVANAKSALADRITAARLLGQAGPELATTALPALLTQQTPPELQQAAVRSLLSLEQPAATGLVLERWSSLGPSTRKDAIDQLTQSRPGAMALLAAIADGHIRPNEVDRDKQTLLLAYPDQTTRDLAKTVLVANKGTRAAIVAQYQSALALTGDPAKGLEVYRKTCVQCHKAAGEGHQVGPELVSVQNKSPEDLLIAILDPNREAQPIFTTYTASTVNGQVYSGLIAADTAASITLRRAEAKEDVVLRDQLDELVSTGLSLMPEGIEKDLTPQQVADLIAFIKNLSAPKN